MKWIKTSKSELVNIELFVFIAARNGTLQAWEEPSVSGEIGSDIPYVTLSHLPEIPEDFIEWLTDGRPGLYVFER